MNSTTTPPVETVPPVVKHSATRRQIRGSSLLLAGRLLSTGVNFATRVLIVRYLSKTDYGALAYAFSILSLTEAIATFGLDRAVTRFVPIYHEQRDYNKLFGTLLMVAGTILSLGLAIILLVFGFQGFVAQSLAKDRLATALLLIIIGLLPLNTIQNLTVSLLAIFGKPRAIFFRKYLLAPGLKLAVVALLIGGGGDVFFLAGGNLVGGFLGMLVNVFILVRVLREEELFRHFDFRTIVVPAREVLAFTLPLLTSDLLYIVMNNMSTIVLEHSQGTAGVAAFRAVEPTAVLNSFVMSSFTVLFTPAAARLFARNDREGINQLYWQTAIWIAVCTFPIFALTFSLARPITVLLYGARYEQSAIVLAVLAFGYYFDAALGFNGLTLKVYGKLRYSVVINVLAGLFNLGAILVLIPRYGALGAAIGTCLALVVHNILKQAGLRLGTGINLFEGRYFRVYLIITLGALGLLLVQWATSAPVYVSLALAGLISLLVLWLNRKMLKVGQTFPELLRFPLVRRFFGESEG